MANWHGYMGVENIALGPVARETLIAELKALGPSSDPQPANMNHWRVRLDDEAVILEALFNEDALTVNTFRNRLAVIFNVDIETITTDATVWHFAGGDTPIVVFSHNGTSYLRIALFGGVGCSWQESGDECRGYLALYSELWEAEQ